MRQRSAYDSRRQEEYAKRLGAGLLVRVDPNSVLLLGRFNQPTRGIPVDFSTISRSIDYRSAVYDRDGKEFTPYEKSRQVIKLTYDEVSTQLGQLGTGQVLVIDPIVTPSDPKIVNKRKARNKKRRIVLERLASEGNE